MSKKFALFTGSALLGFTLLAFTVWQPTVHARGPGFFGHHGGRMGMMGGMGGPMMMPMMLDKLDLTPEQDTKVHAIMDEHKPTFKALFTQLKAAHEEMAGRFLAPGSLSAEDLAPQTATIKQLREQLMNEGMKVALQVREVLTPAQLAKAEDLRKKMDAIREQMRGVMEDEE